MHTCGHAGTWYGGTCRICGMEYCRDCGSPQVVTVRKTQWVQVDGRPPDQVWSEFGEVWPLCHACAAKMPPVYVEPSPPPPVAPPTKYINPTITITNKTTPIDWSRAVKMFEALSAGKVYTGIPSAAFLTDYPAYRGIRKETAKGTAHEWGPFGEGTVTVSAKKAAPPKPPKPKTTPQSVLEADVEKFLREQDDG